MEEMRSNAMRRSSHDHRTAPTPPPHPAMRLPEGGTRRLQVPEKRMSGCPAHLGGDCLVD